MHALFGSHDAVSHALRARELASRQVGRGGDGGGAGGPADDGNSDMHDVVPNFGFVGGSSALDPTSIASIRMTARSSRRRKSSAQLRLPPMFVNTETLPTG